MRRFDLELDSAFGVIFLDLRLAQVRFGLHDSFAGLHAVEKIHRKVQIDLLGNVVVPVRGIPLEEVVLAVLVSDGTSQDEGRLVIAFFDIDVLFIHLGAFVELGEFLAALANICHCGVRDGEIALLGVTEFSLEFRIRIPGESHRVE